jgi:recombination protein RecR
MRYPEHLLKLIAVLKKLPGVGSKTAERFAFHMLSWPEERLRDAGEIIKSIKENLRCCSDCGALVGKENCPFCDLTRRDKNLLCVVATPKEIFSIEETRTYQGLYHVLDGNFSPLQGKISNSPSLDRLKNRIASLQVREVILALDATLEGDATSLFLKKELGTLPVSLSRLGMGMPMGSSLDLLDGGTLGRALSGRQLLK